MPTGPTSLFTLSARGQAKEGTISIAAWVCYLPGVHPFFVDMVQTLDRTIARLERRISSLHAEAARLQAALRVEGRRAEKTAEQTKLAAYREEIADYQATIAQCRSQFEAQVAHRWTSAEITRAKNCAGGSSHAFAGTA